jgi:selenocysteine-specific elongation factor
LPVDRAFVRTGFGTVVTGTAWSGRLADGATVHLLPGDDMARVRGMQVHGNKVEVAEAGQRTALNLAAIETGQVPRGTVVASEGVPCTSMVDVSYRHLAGGEALADGAAVRVLLGTSERMGRLYLAADADEIQPGRKDYAQLRLDAPLPCLPGDRFVVRRSSPVETLGGGEVLDPWAGRMRQKHRIATGKQLARLDRGDTTVWLERAGEVGLEPAEWLRRDHSDRTVVMLGDRVFAPTVAARLQGALLEALADFHTEHPLALGANRRELRRGRLGHLTDRVFDALVDRLADARTVHLDGPMVRVSGFAVALTPAQSSLQASLCKTIHDSGFGGIQPKALHEVHKQPEVSALLRLVESSGEAQQIAGVGWISERNIVALRAQLVLAFAADPVLTPGGFKALSGLTRKSAIPLLEWLDARKWTLRQSEGRLAGPRLG